jgi:predicted Zn-dependent protease
LTFVGDTLRAFDAADPKDKIELFNRSRRRAKRRDRLMRRRAGDAEDVVRRIRDRRRGCRWATILSCRDFARARMFRRALALARHDLATMNMANVYRDLGRPAEAVAALKRLLALTPNNVHVRQQMAQILLDEGQLADAERELTAILKQDEHMAAAHNSLGALKLEQGDAAGQPLRRRAAVRSATA